MTALDVEATKARLPSLTGLRFYAAAVVLLRHTVPDILPIPGLLQLSFIGPVGVSFFFVLSGFVLTWTWAPRGGARHFYLRRVARIVPLHVLTTVLAVAAALAVDPGQADARYWAGTALALLLLQGWVPEFLRVGGNGPSWSLSCEAFFYACFPFLIPRVAGMGSRSIARLCVGLWGAMMVWTLAYAVLARVGVPGVSAFSTYTNPLYRIGEFIIGIGLAIVIRRGWRAPVTLKQALWVTGGAYVALAALDEVVYHLDLPLGDSRGLPLSVHGLLFLPFTALLVAAAASSDVAGHRSPVGGKWHDRLGRWSFALYLVQMAVIIPAEALLPDNALMAERVAFLGALWVACLVAAAALHAWIERPVEKWLRARLLPLRQANRVA